MNSKYPQDEELLLRIKDGDEAIVKALHRQYWQPFGAFFLKRKDLSHAEVLDIYTLSFTQFYFNIKQQKLVAPLGSSLKSYLIGIGKNYMLRHFEQRSRNRENSTDDLDVSAATSLFPRVDHRYEREAQAELIQRLLTQLDADCRRLVTLSFIEENADDAIAEKMNIASTGAVRQRRFKCLAKLRQLFQQVNTKSTGNR